jgi:NADP-dependent 3-hydroxy acid dehydrogenase YdfG
MMKIFLTGASSDIGRAIAEMLVRQGHEVWGTSRNLERIPKMPRLYPVHLDLRPDAIRLCLPANCGPEKR